MAKLNLLLDQSDLLDKKSLFESQTEAVHWVKDLAGKSYFGRVMRYGYAPFFIQREKDLLKVLNQFPKQFLSAYEVRKIHDQYLILQSFAGKRNLQQWIQKKGVFTEKQAMKFLQKMVKILQTLHGLGFVQTEIRPENLYWDNKSSFLLSFSHAMPAGQSYEAEQLPEDLLYTPPERMQGRYMAQSDIYQLGCVLYFVLTGNHIYQLDKVSSPFDQLYAHAFHEPYKLNRLPIFWRHLILWMTQKDIENRPTLADLSQWLQDQLVPKRIRKASVKAEPDFPLDSLGGLAEHHFAYANFKQAEQREAEGDFATAFNLYENLAAHGYSRAKIRLAAFYQQGQVVSGSDTLVMNLYEQAYRRGHPEAAFQLASFYEAGKEVDVDLEQVFRLYLFAAKRGHFAAQSCLGKAYLQGIGTQKDLRQGAFWCHLSEIAR